jgi:hypothetical protein
MLTIMIGFTLATLEDSLQAQEILWTSPYGGIDVATDSGDNVIITGTKRTIKLNPNGDTLWTRALNKMHATGVATDPWGNVIVTGYIYTDTSSLEDYCTIKYDLDGDSIWTRTYDSGDMDEAHGVATDPWGNVIVTGYTWGYEPLGDYCTIKYDPDGNIIWKRIYNWGWHDFAQDVVVDAEGNVIVTGKSDNNINWDWSTVKYCPAGDTLWIRRVDVGIDDWSHGVATDPWGNVIVVGDVDIGGGHSRAFATKYDAKGDTLWIKLNYDVGQFYDVATDTSGNVIMTGNVILISTTQLKLMKCNPDGDTLWTVPIPGYFGWASTDISGNIIVTNGSETIKYKDSHGVGVEETMNHYFPEALSLSQNYPNPFNSKTNIKYFLPKDAHVNLEVYNILGQKVATLVDSKQRRGYKIASWDASSFPTGIYIYRLQKGDYVETLKMVLVK